MSDTSQSQTEESWQEMKKRQEKELEACEHLLGEEKMKEMERLKQKH